MKKEYNEKDMQNKKYAVISYDYEDFVYHLKSTHEDKKMAERRYNYLKRQEEIFFNKSQGYAIDYYIVDINDERVKKCCNYE